MDLGTEAQKYVWEGAIPLQIHLHDSEITTLSSPPPVLILGPRLGYLPLLVPLIKPYFSDTLPPGADTVWFEYKGLPLKWYVPTGVLFDLLCAEPERPWNLTVHFRGYPMDLLTPYEGEENIKWSFINSLKEASYIINGNCKNVMNMSQSDQLLLWQSFTNGNMEGNLRIAAKLKLGAIGEECSTKVISSSTHPQPTSNDTDVSKPSQTGRVPVRLYVRNVVEDIDDLDLSPIDSWDRVSYINKPVEMHKAGGMHTTGKVFTLHDAIKFLLPEFIKDEPSIDQAIQKIKLVDQTKNVETEHHSQDADNAEGEPTETSDKEDLESCSPSRETRIKLIRIQGIEPKLDIPFTWVVKNLINPEHFLHICVYVWLGKDDSRKVNM